MIFSESRSRIVVYRRSGIVNLSICFELQLNISKRSWDKGNNWDKDSQTYNKVIL